METNPTMTNISATVENRPIPPTPPVKDEQKAPGFWAFVGLIVLFAIPFFGLIANIVFACGANKNKSITNFARAYLVVTLVGCILGTLLGSLLVVTVAQWITATLATVQMVVSGVNQFKNGEINEEQFKNFVAPYIREFVQSKIAGLISKEELLAYLEEYIGTELGDLNLDSDQIGDLGELGDLGDLGELGDVDPEDVENFLGENGIVLDNVA